MRRYVTILRSRGAAVIPIEGHELERAAAALPDWRYDGAARTLHSLRSEDGGLQAWLTDGQLWTNNPDGAARARLVTLAGALGARLRGDGGETYRTPFETYRHPDDAAAPRAAAPPASGLAIPYRILLGVSLLAALARQILRPSR